MLNLTNHLKLYLIHPIGELPRPRWCLRGLSVSSTYCEWRQWCRAMHARDAQLELPIRRLYCVCVCSPCMRAHVFGGRSSDGDMIGDV